MTPSVQPIELPANGATPTGIVSLIGWAGSYITWFGLNLGQLQLARVTVLPTAHCENFLHFFKIPNNTHFCTGPLTGGLSPCTGDVGSSVSHSVLGTRTILLGLVSMRQPCGLAGEPGIYTQVSKFTNWINQVMN